MHILAGLDRPTTGTVTLDGDEITGLDDRELTRLRRDKLGFIFQAFNLIPVFSATENVELPLLLTHVPEREARQRARCTGARSVLQLRLELTRP